MMDEDGDDKDDTKRKTRNLSEKKRRDQFNLLVTELSTLITSNNRKMDKSTVLKSTISFLKNHNEVTVRSRAHDVQEDWKPAFLSNEEFTYLVLEALEGFVMVFSTSGRIYYVSESITSLLGHNPENIVNKSIFDLTFEEDRPNLYNLLQSNASAAEQIPNNQENEMKRFQFHFRRGTLDFREEVSYDLVQFYGHFRTNPDQPEGERDVMDYREIESRVLCVCIGRLHTPQLISDVSLVDSARNEFTSRHSLEWKFLFLDHRAPPIIGYLPFEVLGTSGYDYYHFDDLEKVVACHEALMQKGELTSCYYRFLTKGQQWIWLQTRFYITYHQWNSKPEFVVCTHRVVSYADVANTTKEEEVEQDTDVSEADANQNNNMKDTPSDDPMPPISPSYMSEGASDAYGNSYQPISQEAKEPCNISFPPVSPTFTAVTVTDGSGNSFQLVSQNATSDESPLSALFKYEFNNSFSNANPPVSKNTLNTPPADERFSTSPYLSDRSDNINSYPKNSQNSLTIPLSEERTISPSYKSELSESLCNSFPSCRSLNVPPSEEAILSPSYMSICSNSSTSSFPPISRNNLNIPTDDRSGMSPMNMSDRSDSFCNSYPTYSQHNFKIPPSQENSEMSSYMSALSEPYPYFTQITKPASVKSASASSTTGTIATAATTGISWSRGHTRYTGGSDTASLSGESRSSQRNSERESHKPSELLAPQHGIGVQYLDPSPYVGGVPVPPGMLPLSTLPVIVTQDQAQMQEQLQRKHEELQQMIVRQQEELRQVKEQLLLARLGILQPLINVPIPYTSQEDIQNQQRMTPQQPYIRNPRAPIGYPPHVALPLHPQHPPLPPIPPHPPHPSDQHQHMPQ